MLCCKALQYISRYTPVGQEQRESRNGINVASRVQNGQEKSHAESRTLLVSIKTVLQLILQGSVDGVAQLPGSRDVQMGRSIVPEPFAGIAEHLLQ